MHRFPPVPAQIPAPLGGLRRALAGVIAALIMMLVTMLAPLTTAAQELPQPISDSVNDFAGVLSADDIAQLERLLRDARAETDIQIVVATIDGPVADIATYARNLFNAWGVGAAGRNDGILILVDRGTRQVRIALGSGYDPVWDGPAQRAIDTAMLAPLRDGQFAKGLEDGAKATLDRVARPFAAGQMRPEADRSRPIGPMLLAGAFFGLVLLLIIRGRRSRSDTGITQAGLRDGDTRGPLGNRDRNNGPGRGEGGSGGSGGGGRSSGGGASGRF